MGPPRGVSYVLGMDTQHLAVAPPARGTETVLIVEDDKLLRAAIRRVLRESGYAVREVATGREALELLREPGAVIDVVLADVVLRDSSAHETFGELRRVCSCGPRLLFMSGYPRDVLEHYGVDGLTHPLLRKPFVDTELLRGVRSVLDRGDET
jgi:two-component system cell cycle sensor histidine kinase/response regulator CckA